MTGKPVIIGNKLPVQYIYGPPDPISDMAEYLECDLDIGHSSLMARNIVMLCKGYTTVLTLDFGFIVQSDEEDELPEHLLGAVRIHRLDPDNSPMFHSEEESREEGVVEAKERWSDDEFWDCNSD